ITFPRTSWICWISLGQLNSRRPRLKRVRFLGEVEMKERISVWEGEGGSVNETLARNITNTNNTRNLAVGTLKKSIDTRSRTLLSRKVRHVWDGAVLRFGMSRETGRSETSIPSLSSSP
ncbi:MAG: hypothetical protein DMG15_28415, partial [Acidobacteria bacterium]